MVGVDGARGLGGGGLGALPLYPLVTALLSYFEIFRVRGETPSAPPLATALVQPNIKF